MTVINMPGFTAEASIGKTSTQYRTRSDWTTSDMAHVIVPQGIKDFFKGVGESLLGAALGVGGLAWSGLQCSYATAKVLGKCAEAFDTGDVQECADGISEWKESCFAD